MIVCHCFGISEEQVRAEVNETGVSATADWIAGETRAGRCDCRNKNPAGVCCLAEIKRLVDDERKETRCGR